MPDQTTPITFRGGGEGWPDDRGRRLALRLAGGVAMVVLGGGGVALILAGHPVLGGLLIVFAGALGVAPYVGDNRRAVPPRTVEVDGLRGTLLPVNPPRRTLLVVLAVVGAGLLLGAGVLVYAAVTEGVWINLIGVALLGSTGGILMLGVAGGLRSLRTPARGILMTPAGVQMRTERVSELVPWEEIVRVRDHWTRAPLSGLPTPDDQIQAKLSLETSTDVPLLPVQTGLMGMPPAQFRDALRHYLDHPEHRAELTSEQAVHRITTLAEGPAA